MGHATAIEVLWSHIKEEAVWAKVGAAELPIDGADPGIEALLEDGLITIGYFRVLCHLVKWPSSGRNTFDVLCEEVNAMRQVSAELNVETQGPGLYEITRALEVKVIESGVMEGLATVFIRHTSASLTIQENADPAVQRDLLCFFAKIAPELDDYAHSAEGPDDMPAHIKSALTQVSLSIPISNGQMVLGTWQGIYLFEHRRQSHRRCIQLNVLGE